jgi:excisionase family DNA binding protein
MTTLEQLRVCRRLLTAEELAALLNVSEKTVYRWSKSGSLPSVRLGTLVRFEPAAVSVWLRERGAAA